MKDYGICKQGMVYVNSKNGDRFICNIGVNFVVKSDVTGEQITSSVVVKMFWSKFLFEGLPNMDDNDFLKSFEFAINQENNTDITLISGGIGCNYFGICVDNEMSNHFIKVTSIFYVIDDLKDCTVRYNDGTVIEY